MQREGAVAYTAPAPTIQNKGIRPIPSGLHLLFPKRPYGTHHTSFGGTHGLWKLTDRARLDELHAGLTAFFDGHLSLAPLESLKPTNILELGSGSGAWYAREATTIEIMFCVGSLDNPRAIQAARQFPDARITAVDIAPMPERDVPSNIHFRKMDITKRLPFNSEGYDVVHARFVMMHLHGGEEILKRVVHLVRPGGWLIVEDPNDDNTADRGQTLGPGMSAFVGAWLAMLRARGANPCIGRDLGRILEASGAFSEVHENDLGAVWKTNMVRVARDLPARFAPQGITEEVAQQHLAELQDPSREISTDIHLTAGPYGRLRFAPRIAGNLRSRNIARLLIFELAWHFSVQESLRAKRAALGCQPTCDDLQAFYSKDDHVRIPHSNASVEWCNIIHGILQELSLFCRSVDEKLPEALSQRFEGDRVDIVLRGCVGVDLDNWSEEMESWFPRLRAQWDQLRSPGSVDTAGSATKDDIQRRRSIADCSALSREVHRVEWKFRQQLIARSTIIRVYASDHCCMRYMFKMIRIADLNNGIGTERTAINMNISQRRVLAGPRVIPDISKIARSAVKNEQRILNYWRVTYD
ncbi:predicted protein [Postia placenta Mad-698-R]|nr:predicted protein [Postia placenta Mad-698-R]